MTQTDIIIYPNNLKIGVPVWLSLLCSDKVNGKARESALGQRHSLTDNEIKEMGKLEFISILKYHGYK
jgi:hypothetical protein